MNQSSEKSLNELNTSVDGSDKKIINILLIEDNPGDIRLIQELMKEVSNGRFNLLYHDNLTEGMQLLNDRKFNVILLDLSLPDSEGLNTLEKILKNAKDIPIIILTGTDDQTLAIEAVKSGAQDYLIKGKVNGILLERTIFYSIERQNIMKKLKQSEKKFRLAFHRASFYKDILAHDMNNILQGIMSGTQLLDVYFCKTENQEKVSDLSEIIINQIMRGARLITNVRRISLLEESKLFIGSIEITNLLNKSIEVLKAGFPQKNINIDVSSFKKQIFLQANELIQDVFDNLLINAVRHNQNNQIEIQVKISEAKEHTTNMVKLEFIDNGNGIEDLRKDKIFLRGNKEDKYISGMGLGLSLVVKIVERYNGKIWVEDKIKGDYTMGSNFILLIPEVT